MGFFDEVTLVVALLQREGRLTYRGLQREFGFDAALLDDLRCELIFRRIAVDEQGEGLVWTGVGALTGRPPGVPINPSVVPASATPLSPSASVLPPLNLAVEASPASDAEALPGRITADPQIDPSEVQPAPSWPGRAMTDSVSAHRPLEAERRQLTVMFCDFVGSSSQRHAC